uniref:Uncharacterized protein n=1 Tax=Panagrolaimus sp. JU765 TaxID=591449 RepID=A0AC34R825_9BILA
MLTGFFQQEACCLRRNEISMGVADSFFIHKQRAFVVDIAKTPILEANQFPNCSIITKECKSQGLEGKMGGRYGIGPLSSSLHPRLWFTVAATTFDAAVLDQKRHDGTPLCILMIYGYQQHVYYIHAEGGDLRVLGNADSEIQLPDVRCEQCVIIALETKLNTKKVCLLH